MADMDMGHGGFGRRVRGDGCVGMVRRRDRDEFDPPPVKVWVWTTWVTAAFIVWGLLFAGTAEASPVCVHRSAAHAAEHGTTSAADSRSHVRNGERPTCGQENDGRSDSDRERQRDSNGEFFWPFEDDRDGKSRYCRRRWFC